jgi:hypothetical protein
LLSRLDTDLFLRVGSGIRPVFCSFCIPFPIGLPPERNGPCAGAAKIAWRPNPITTAPSKTTTGATARSWWSGPDHYVT